MKVDDAVVQLAPASNALAARAVVVYTLAVGRYGAEVSQVLALAGYAALKIAVAVQFRELWQEEICKSHYTAPF